MKLGDFFAAAPYARPVNPRPVRFTAMARGKVLPGTNRTNTTGVPVASTITAAMIFLGGDGSQEARIAARKHLRQKYLEAEDIQEINDGDFNIEFTYQLLWRVLHEWDENEHKIGDRMFVTVDLLRELVEVPEAQRVFNAWAQYINDEHPEVLDKPSFPGIEAGSPRVAAVASR